MDMFSACNGIIENLYFKFLSSVYKWIKCLFFFFHWFALMKLHSACNIMSFVSIKYRFLICFMKYSDDITSNTLSSPSCWMMVYKKTQLTKFFFLSKTITVGRISWTPGSIWHISIHVCLFRSIDVVSFKVCHRVKLLSSAFKKMFKRIIGD